MLGKRRALDKLILGHPLRMAMGKRTLNSPYKERFKLTPIPHPSLAWFSRNYDLCLWQCCYLGADKNIISARSVACLKSATDWFEGAFNVTAF